MLAEQHLEVRVGEAEGVVDEFGVGHGREVRARRMQPVDQPLVFQHVGQVRRGQHPAERLGDLLGEIRPVEAGLHHELRHTGCISEERVVDVLGGHVRRAVTEHPQRARVEVGVAAGDPEEHTLVVG